MEGVAFVALAIEDSFFKEKGAVVIDVVCGFQRDLCLGLEIQVVFIDDFGIAEGWSGESWGDAGDATMGDLGEVLFIAAVSIIFDEGGEEVVRVIMAVLSFDVFGAGAFELGG